MAYALIAQVGAVGTNPTTSSINTTGADLLLVFSGAINASETISDSKSNSWTDLTVAGSTLTGRISYSRGGTVGSGHTFTATSGVNGGLIVMAFSGSVASPVAAGTDTVGNTASGTSQGSGSITPPETDCLVVSGMTYNVAPNGVGVPSGFTVPSGASIDAVNAVSFGYYFAYEIQTAIVTRSPTWTLDTSASFMSVASVIFKDTGTGGGGSNWGPMLGQQLNRIVQG